MPVMSRVLLLLPTTTYRTEAFLSAAHQLEVEVTVGREDFAAACAEQPERTAKMHAHLPQPQADVELEKAKKAAKAARESCGACTGRVCAYSGPCRTRCRLCCFELCELKDSESLVILSDPDTNQEYTAAMCRAARSFGADVLT